jgi:hypothetical protein
VIWTNLNEVLFRDILLVYNVIPLSMTTANHLNVLFKAGSLVGTIDFWQLLDGDKVGTPTSSESSLFILPGKFLINLMEQVCFLF